MPYDGEVLKACGIVHADLSEISAVAVPCDRPNLLGHLLLFSPKGGGYYFHVTGDTIASGMAHMRGFPMYMIEPGYRRYLKETGKRELRRRLLKLPNPAGAFLYLERLVSEKWTWMVLPNNCVSFVEEVIAAGVGERGSYSNCPALSTSDSSAERIGFFYQWMKSGAYRVYGTVR